MNEVIIVGAGGFGRTVYWQCVGDYGYERHWTIKGFLDDRANILDGFKCPAPIIGDPLTYDPKPGEIYITALGEPAHRRHYSAPLLAKNAYFFNLCSEVAYPESVKLGRGIIFERKVQIASDTRIGDFAVVLSMTVIGHDVTIGDYVQIGSFTFLGARVTVGNDVTIHPHSCVLPNIRIGDGAVIGAGSVVVRNVPANSTVFGNPAKVVFRR